MRNKNQLHPKLQEKIEELLLKCSSTGLSIGIGECLRTKEEQNKLYAQGRTTKGNIVTNAKGSTYSSMHQWGIAFDFYRNDGKGAFNDTDNFFKKVGNIGKSIGLEWGGDWKTIQDKPHFQLSSWGSTTKTLKKLYGNPNNFFKTWERGDEMTQQEKQEFQQLKDKVNQLEKSKVIYNYIDNNMPSWARPTIQKLVNRGILKGDSNGLDLTDDLLRLLVINDRTGIYDK